MITTTDILQQKWSHGKRTTIHTQQKGYCGENKITATGQIEYQQKNCSNIKIKI